jgi:regulator of RNase E activity RraA
VMAGPALTVRTRPGDNLMVHKALDMAAPGDIVVVDAGGDLSNAIIGEIMTSYAQTRSIGGIVVNGAIRDAGTIRDGDFPVYAAGVTHSGPYKDGPGDLVIGDEDGLLCVPFDACETVLAATQAKHAAELEQLADIAAGKADRSWVDAALKRLGCEIEN